MDVVIASLTHWLDMLARVVGTDVLVSIAALAVIVLFLYAEGRGQSRPLH